MRDKWHIKKRGYLKIHVEVNVKTKEILSMKITNEHFHDSKALPGLINDIVKSDKIITIGKLFAYGAYDGDMICRYLSDNIIQPYVKLRKNARTTLKTGNILRNLTVLAQKSELQRWKEDSISYGQIWIVETVFSCIKRMFVEYVYSVKLNNITKEMILKVSLYNKMTSV